MNSDIKLFTEKGALKVDLQPEGDTLLVTFGGLLEGIGLPRFEFFKITKKLPVKLAFVRDESQAWYHANLPGIGNGVEDVAEKIRQIQKEASAKRLVCIGNSMGGYAALLIGSLAKANKVIAFAPQTFISRFLRLVNFDSRYPKQIKKTLKSPYALPQAFDLKKFLSPPGYDNAVIYADKNNRLDAIHARRMKGLPRTEILWVDGGHALVKKLRDSGELGSVILQACSAKKYS